jgi:6-phosphofructokinase 1
VRQPDGSVKETDRCDDLVKGLEAAGIDAVVAVGGDGSLTIASALAKKGVRIVGVPKTIDNDLSRTVVTFGFDTAVSFATECIDRLHSTAASHRRVMVVEVMGRYAGWIALNAGVSSSVDAILIPEIPYDIAKVAAKIQSRYVNGAAFAIVVVAEGASPRGGRHSVIEKKAGQAERLGGAGARVGAEIAAATGRDTRVVVLGHLLRGGTPTTFDRLISLRFGAAAVRALASGKSGVMVALDPPTVRYVPLADAAHRMKRVPTDCDTIQTARALGICMGD